MEQEPRIKCDTKKCVECHACEVSCKATHDVEPGVKWRWVKSIWSGKFPDVSNYSFSIGCYHCKDAPCIEACPSEALYQKADRWVLVNSDKCQGSQACLPVCPYDIPQFGKNGKMQKCDLCANTIKQGELPVCVKTCPSGALTLEI